MPMPRSCHFVGAVAFLALSGCKPKAADSSTKSLDNLTRKDGAEETHNQCTGPDTGFAPPAGRLKFEGLSASEQAEAKEAVDKALTAVTTKQKRAFFGFAKLVLVPKLKPADCTGNRAAQVFATRSGADLRFCWAVNDGQLQALMVGTPKVIEHEMVRLFAFGALDIVAPTIDNWDEKKAAQNRVAVSANTFIRRRAIEVTNALLVDATTNKEIKVDQVAKAITSGDVSGMTIAARAVMAEAFDSAYCSPTTRAKFKKMFPKTYEAFVAPANPKASGAGTRDDVREAFDLVYSSL